MKKEPKKTDPRPAKEAKKEDKVAYEDAWYRALKAQAENRPHPADEEPQPRD